VVVYFRVRVLKVVVYFTFRVRLVLCFILHLYVRLFICGLSNLVSHRLQQVLLQLGACECCVVDVATPSCLLLKVLQSSM
jgi:hypothetical protein